MESYKDEIVLLQVNNWQTADKKAVCFSRDHGKIVFMAYGARYPKSVSGRLLQPFACLEAELYPGTRVDKLKSCQLAAPMPQMELEQMAYGFLMAEMTERLTEQGEPSESLYLLLRRALQLLVKRNPRVAAMAYLIQLLDQCMKCVCSAAARRKGTAGSVRCRAALFVRSAVTGREKRRACSPFMKRPAGCGNSYACWTWQNRNIFR